MTKPTTRIPSLSDDSPPAGDGAARVLVVDDNPDMRLYVAGLLSRRWRVETCADGREALEKARSAPPDLVLSDVTMAGFDGFELLRELRAEARTRSVPVILLSARAGEDSRLEGLDAGADEYLVKPFSAQELVARVESALRLSELRKDNQEALRRSEERFKIAAQATNDLIYEWDLASGHLEWFGDVDRVLGFAPGELVRTADAWSAQIHPDDRPRVAAAIRRHLARSGGGLFSEEYRVRTKDGAWRVWIDRGTALRDAEGRASRWYGAVSDITERRRAEQEILRLNATLEARVHERTGRLQELVRELETFAYTVAHDLRAPLRALRGLSEVLVEDHAPQLGESGSDLARRIADAAERMDALTRDLLDYSRVALTPLELERVDLEPLVDRSLRELEADLADRRAEVEVERPLPCVRGQSVLLGQAVLNLLSNAIKFVEPGTAPRVRVSAVRRANQVRLQVKDNGIGVQPNHLGKLFGVFERLEPRRFPGTGIGLAIVRKVAERMGGRAGVDSEPGRGSTFWIELPSLE